MTTRCGGVRSLAVRYRLSGEACSLVSSSGDPDTSTSRKPLKDRSFSTLAKVRGCAAAAKWRVYPPSGAGGLMAHPVILVKNVDLPALFGPRIPTIR